MSLNGDSHWISNKKRTPFSQWIWEQRDNGLDSYVDRMSITDVDWIVHKYRDRTGRDNMGKVDLFMLLELKTKGREMPPAQQDTLRIVNALFRHYAEKSNGTLNPFKLEVRDIFLRDRVVEHRYVKYFGAFLLELEGERPDEGKIKWHGRTIDEQTLVRVLAFDIDPRSLQPRDERDHHGKERKQMNLPGLSGRESAT